MAWYPLSPCLWGQGRAVSSLGLLRGDAYEQGKAGGERGWGFRWVTVLLPPGKRIGRSTWRSHRSLLPEEYFQNKSHQPFLARVDLHSHVLAARTACPSPCRFRDSAQTVGLGWGCNYLSRCKRRC